MTAHFHGCPRKPWPTFPSLLCFFMSPAPTCGVENGGGRGSRTTMPLKKNPSTCVRGYLIQRDGEVWCVYDPPDVAREPSQPSERTRSHPHRGSSCAPLPPTWTLSKFSLSVSRLLAPPVRRITLGMALGTCCMELFTRSIWGSRRRAGTLRGKCRLEK